MMTRLCSTDEWLRYSYAALRLNQNERMRLGKLSYMYFCSWKFSGIHRNADDVVQRRRRRIKIQLKPQHFSIAYDMRLMKALQIIPLSLSLYCGPFILFSSIAKFLSFVNQNCSQNRIDILLRRAQVGPASLQIFLQCLPGFISATHCNRCFSADVVGGGYCIDR